MYKRICAVLAAVLVVAAAGVYIVYFHRPPTANILARNRAARQALHGERPPLADYDEDYDDSDLSEAKKSERKWNRFIAKNQLVSIGELYDKCGMYINFQYFMFMNIYFFIFEVISLKE